MLLSGSQRPGWREETTGREKNTQGNAGSQAMATGTHGRSRAKKHNKRQKEKNTIRGKQKERRKSKDNGVSKRSPGGKKLIEKGRQERTEGNQTGTNERLGQGSGRGRR